MSLKWLIQMDIFHLVNYKAYNVNFKFQDYFQLKWLKSIETFKMILITVRVRSMREGNVFHFVCPSTGGGYPAHWSLVPGPFWGTEEWIPRSLIPGPFWERGTLISGPRSFWGQEVPQSRLGQGYTFPARSSIGGPLLPQTWNVMNRIRRRRYTSCGHAGGRSFWTIASWLKMIGVTTCNEFSSWYILTYKI